MPIATDEERLQLIDSRLQQIERIRNDSLDYLLLFAVFGIGIWYAFETILGGILLGWMAVMIRSSSDRIVIQVIAAEIQSLAIKVEDQEQVNARLEGLLMRRRWWWRL